MERIWGDLIEILKRSDASEVTIYTIGNLLRELDERGFDRKAPDLCEIVECCSNGERINVIPSSVKVSCCEELLVVCFDKDSFTERLREMIYSSGIICRGIHKLVIFMTTKFDNKNFEKHIDALQIMKRENIRFCFIQLARQGASELHVI